MCIDLGLPAEGTVETIRALVAKWVDETKDDEMMAVARVFEEKFTQRSTPRQRAVRKSEKRYQK